MKQVCLYASELSIITRHNRYENISKIIYKIWEKNFNDDLKNLEKLLLDQNVSISKIENNDECIERITKSYNIDLKDHINTCLKTKDVQSLSDNQENIIKKCQNMNHDDLSKLKSSIISKTNTNFGTRFEGNSIEIYQQKFNTQVNLTTKFFKKKIGSSNNIDWFMGGKIDGITNDKILIEVKNRTKKLFYNLRDYEKVQVMVYLKILDLKKAHLVESLKNNKEEMNMIEIDFDADFWKQEILKKIVLFINFFDIFINDIDLRIKFLKNSEFIDDLYEKYLFN